MTPSIKPSRRVRFVVRRLKWVIEKIVSELDGKVDPRVWGSLSTAKKELNFSIALLRSLEVKATEPFHLNF